MDDTNCGQSGNGLRRGVTVSLVVLFVQKFYPIVWNFEALQFSVCVQTFWYTCRYLWKVITCVYKNLIIVTDACPSCMYMCAPPWLLLRSSKDKWSKKEERKLQELRGVLCNTIPALWVTLWYVTDRQNCWTLLMKFSILNLNTQICLFYNVA